MGDNQQQKPLAHSQDRETYIRSPTHEQVILFSATLRLEGRPICRKFMRNPLKIYVDDKTELTPQKASPSSGVPQADTPRLSLRLRLNLAARSPPLPCE